VTLDPDEERAMTHGGVIYVRTFVAFVIGMCADRILFAYAYPIWLTALSVAICAFALDLKQLRPREVNHAREAWLTAFDSCGFLIPSVMVIGLTIIHTVVLIRDTITDPTTHNLFPFEFIFAWIAAGVPAMAGSMIARAISWIFNRLLRP
jgi:hypothetical protein